jgi:hypothetical protein
MGSSLGLFHPEHTRWQLSRVGILPARIETCGMVKDR